jgi:hypothetical protein
MGRPRNKESTSPVTFTLPSEHLALLRELSRQLYGDEGRYANLIREDVRAGLVLRGKLKPDPYQRKRQRSIPEHFVLPLIGWRGGPVPNVRASSSTIDSSAEPPAASTRFARRTCVQCSAEIRKEAVGSRVGGQAFAPETCGHETCVEMNGGVR